MKEYLSKEILENQLTNLSQLTFEITDRCNLDCKYCGYGELYNDYDERVGNDLSFEKAVAIIDYLNVYWQLSNNQSGRFNVYISFYGGEPLLNINFVKKVIDYIERIKSSNRFFTFSMTTNAVLLDRYIDYLVEKDFNLLISLDGDKSNNQYRVNKANKSSFEKIISNIDKVKAKYPDYFKDKVNFNSVLHDKNSVDSIYSFFKTNYNKTPSIASLNNMGIREDKKNVFEEKYKNVANSMLSTNNYKKIMSDMFIKSPIHQDACTFLHQYSGFVFKNYRELLLGKPENIKWITGTCAPFGKKMFVTVNGKILPCERIGHQFALGQINENNKVILDIEAIVQKYNIYFSKMEAQCNACYIKKSCTQCIFNLENIEEENITCNDFTNKEDFIKYTNSNLIFFSQNPIDYYRLMEEVILE